MLDLITQVRNLALEAELKGQKALAEKLRAVADEEEARRIRWEPNRGGWHVLDSAPAGGVTLVRLSTKPPARYTFDGPTKKARPFLAGLLPYRGAYRFCPGFCPNRPKPFVQILHALNP
jgi:hypothetical protein